MQGIYKITNTVSKHAYIGQSNNIEYRFAQHIKRAYNSKKEHNKALYVAMRLYGVDKFTFEILEELQDISDLNSREMYWISYYNTYYDGYNETPGGDGVRGHDGEKHHNHKLFESDVIDIRRRYAACKESVQDIFESYSDRITKAGFAKIYTWQTWKKFYQNFVQMK